MSRTDDFQGDNAHLVECINALLDMDDAKALVPHGLGKGSHAYRLLNAAAHRIATASARITGGDKDRENLVARPSDEQLDDDLNDILAPFHWEAWKAALFDSCPDGWPDDDEQEIICRRVDSMAVGEHYEAWSSEVREKIKALSAIPAIDGGRFDDWTDAMFISECRAQAFAHLEPDFSRFMSALANRIAAYSTNSADPVVEQMAQALEEIIEATKYADGRAWDANTIARRALAAYRGK